MSQPQPAPSMDLATMNRAVERAIKVVAADTR